MQKRKFFVMISFSILAAILLSACGAAAPTQSPLSRDLVGGAPEVGLPQPGVVKSSGEFVNGAGGATAPTNSDRLVIKTANLSIVVDDPESSMDDIAALAKQLGGFVVSSNLYQSTLSNGLEVPAGNITIRVPEESLLDALKTIQESARTVLSKNQSGQDVTAEVTDLQSRLRNLEAAETLLRKIMDEAKDTEDILNAFNQLNAITEQIEVLKGQIKFYEESSALSAITVDLTASLAVQPLTIGGWEPVGVAKDAIQALINALQTIANILIWLGLYILPIAVVVGVPVWLLVSGIRRWRTKRRK